MFSENLIFLDIPGETREQVLTDIIEKMGEKSGRVKNYEKFKEEVLEREQLGGTGIGDEVAIPHARTNQVDEIIIVFARTQNGIDFDAIDGTKVRFIFLIAVPAPELKTYLTTLATISRMVKNSPFRHVMRHATSGKEFMNAIIEIEEEHSF